MQQLRKNIRNKVEEKKKKKKKREIIREGMGGHWRKQGHVTHRKDTGEEGTIWQRREGEHRLYTPWGDEVQEDCGGERMGEGKE